MMNITPGDYAHLYGERKIILLSMVGLAWLGESLKGTETEQALELSVEGATWIGP